MFEKNFKFYQRKNLVFLGALTVLVMAIFFLSLSSPQQNFISVSQKNEQDKVELTLLIGKEAIGLSSPQKYAELPDHIKNNIAPPYSLSTRFLSEKGEVRNLVIVISKDFENISLLVDGYAPTDLIDLSMNGKKILKKFPVDWSGRTEISKEIKTKNNKNICFKIAYDNLCHTLPKGNRA